MADKPKLTLEAALAVFPNECKAVFKIGDHEFQLLKATPRDVTDAKLAWCALHWLAGRPATLVTREILWADDPLSMLLEEVADIMANEKEG